MNPHPIFGPLEQDETGDWFGTLRLEGEKRGRIMLELNPLEETAWGERTGKVFLEHIQNESALRLKICTEMLELAQDWFQDDENPDHVLTLEEFVGLIRLNDVSLHEDGSSSWWYDDGEVFAGHVIIAELVATGSFDYAGIHG